MKSSRSALCSTLALATAMLFPSAVSAQSFQGTGVVGSGSATISTGPGTTTVTVASPQSVINWTPADNAVGTGTSILFQPANTTATFTTPAGSSLTDFAVLNRIIAADSDRQIVLSGNILSNLQGSASRTAGTVYFYSPSGIIIGATAVINVGNLGLTTADPLTDLTGNWIDFGPGGERIVSFGPSLSGRAVVTNPGSSISTLNRGSYVAMVAPRVQHGGTITTNGQAALVAAEAATINFSPDGLFDIQVSIGTTDAFGVINSGTITGGASTGSGDLRRIYMLALPKNSALTMTFQSGGSLGFDVAGAASVDGNAVVLSAGQNIVDGIAESAPERLSGGLGSILVQNSSFTSAVNATATSSIAIGGNSANSFASDLRLEAGSDIGLTTSGTAGRFTVAGALIADSSRAGRLDGNDGSAGTITLSAIGGARMNLLGGAYLYADGYGAASGLPLLNGGSGRGGTIGISASTGGSLAVAGDLFASASGFGGSAGAAGIAGGSGTGGSIALATNGAGSISVEGATSLIAAGNAGGSGECFGCGAMGGEGRGGTIQVSTAGSGVGTIVFAELDLSASGRGGTGDLGTAGAGIGGTLQLISGGLGGVIRANSVELSASGSGGDHTSGGQGGAGRGGSVILGPSATTASLTVSGDVSASADGFGGASFGSGGTAGSGSGGDVTMSSAGLFGVGGSFAGGAVGQGGFGGSGAAGGAGAGGGLLFGVTGQALVAGDLLLDAGTRGGSGQFGGAATAGTATLRIEGGSATVADVLLSANARGGASSTGAGGSATGGSNTILVTKEGTLFAGESSLSAVATGGSGASTGMALARGGNGLSVTAGDATFLSLSVDVEAADGLTAGGTTDRLRIADGAVIVTGELDFTTDGTLSLRSEDGGSLAAESISLAAADFAGTGSSTGSAGTFHAGEWVVTTDNDFVAEANLRSDGGFTLTAPGNIHGLDLTSGGAVALEAVTGDLVLRDVTASAATSLRAGTDVTLRNATLASTLQMQAGRDLTAGAITATNIAGTAVRNAAIDGIWAAPVVELRSAGIEIASSGGISAGTGRLRLISTSSAQTQIGDGLSPSGGHALSNAEFNRLSGGQVEILAAAGTTSPVDMRIGDLTIGPDMLRGDTASLTFGMGTAGPASGTMRIEGDVVSTSLGAEQTVRFTAGLLELAAEIGSISLTNPTGGLSGRLVLTADNIRVASTSLLDRLRASPQFVGREEELNAPAAVQRPEGILRAGAIVANAAQSFVVQNVGTADIPAGILTGNLLVPAGSAGPIELIINGQLVTPGGTLTGRGVLDALIADPRFDASAFGPASTVNGCKLDGAGCEPVAAPPFVPIDIRFVLADPLGDKLFPEDGDLPGGPIGPPEKLVDTQPLGPDRDVEEPVTGGGNPALIERAPPSGASK